MSASSCGSPNVGPTSAKSSRPAHARCAQHLSNKQYENDWESGDGEQGGEEKEEHFAGARGDASSDLQRMTTRTLSGGAQLVPIAIAPAVSAALRWIP